VPKALALQLFSIFNFQFSIPMRAIANLYQHLHQLIQEECLNDDNTPVFRWFDLWWGQTDYPELAQNFDYPALFLAYSGQSQSIGEASQVTPTTLSFYVATNDLAESYEGGAEANSLQFLEVQARLYELLHNYAHNDTGTLQHTGFAPYNSQTNVLVQRITFTTTLLFDDANIKKTRQNRVDLESVTPSRQVNSIPPPPPETDPAFHIPLS
jgi:hypothetical protein